MIEPKANLIIFRCFYRNSLAQIIATPLYPTVGTVLTTLSWILFI